jgi:outer membrane protein
MWGIKGLSQDSRAWAWRTLMAGSIAALTLPMAASAADMDSRFKAPPADYDWTITVGIEGKVEPIFLGSKDFTVRPNPLFDIRRYGTPERFRAPRDGISFALFEGSNFQIGPVGQIRIGRRESDDPAALRGLGNVPWAGEIGAFAEYWFVPWLRARAEVRQGVTGHHGLVADLTADAVVPVTPQLTLSGGPRATLVTAAANQPYFSINDIQSIASGLPVYSAGGGLRSVGAGAQARYFWTPQLATHVFVEYDRLTDGAADSPLVTQRGSPNQVTIGFGVTRSFDIKQPW